MAETTIIVAFIAGIVSFLSPCVVPLMPAFLAYLAGTNVGEAKTNRKEIFLNTVFFVLGFTVVFAALGVLLNTLLEAIAYDVQIWLSRIGGAIIIFFGLYLTGLLKIPFLDRGHKWQPKKFNSRYLTSFVFGLAFAAGWTPCVGAVLGGILGLAASAPGSAFALLLAYAIGLSLPFLLVGLFTAQAAEFLQKHTKAFHYINVGFGVLLIALGILVFTQDINRLANFGFVNDLVLSN